ncbi:hypothetical protein L1887_29023 [Cichorium endivia]|nr:hypothetical protein L1887_29023 [Cichorium endivia]
MATSTFVSTHHKEDGFNKQSQNRSLMKATRIRGKLLLLDRNFRTFLVQVKSSPSKSDSSGYFKEGFEIEHRASHITSNSCLRCQGLEDSFTSMLESMEVLAMDLSR